MHFSQPRTGKSFQTTRPASADGLFFGQSLGDHGFLKKMDGDTDIVSAPENPIVSQSVDVKLTLSMVVTVMIQSPES
jgi:hypothetical protein